MCVCVCHVPICVLVPFKLRFTPKHTSLPHTLQAGCSRVRNNASGRADERGRLREAERVEIILRRLIGVDANVSSPTDASDARCLSVNIYGQMHSNAIISSTEM